MEDNHDYFQGLKENIKELRELCKEDDTPTNKELLRLAEEAFEEALVYEC